MMQPKLTLYHYWRSSSSWRVRWGFAIKGIHCEFKPVNLLGDDAESVEHRHRNPLGFVPALEITHAGQPSIYLAESTAILEWAEENYPKPAILPHDSMARAYSRQLAQIINAGTQPLQNLNTLDFYSTDPAARKGWAQHWIREGLNAFETLATQTAGHYSVGDEITVADLYLIPQVYNAARFEVTLEAYPTIARINQVSLATEGCIASHPDRFAP